MSQIVRQRVTIPLQPHRPMFRITRGHHVQHIHFPLPVIRDLDADEGTGEDADPSESAAPAATQDETADADRSTGAAK